MKCYLCDSVELSRKRRRYGIFICIQKGEFFPKRGNYTTEELLNEYET